MVRPRASQHTLISFIIDFFSCFLLIAFLWYHNLIFVLFLQFKIAEWMFHLTTNQKFDIAIMMVILLNMITMAMEHYNMSRTFEDFLKYINIVFIGIFTGECVMKLMGLRFYYFKEPWNIFDFVVVVLSILGKLTILFTFLPVFFLNSGCSSKHNLFLVPFLKFNIFIFLPHKRQRTQPSYSPSNWFHIRGTSQNFMEFTYLNNYEAVAISKKDTAIYKNLTKDIDHKV